MRKSNGIDSRVRLKTDDSRSGDFVDLETEENSKLFMELFNSNYKANNLKYINVCNSSKHRRVNSEQ